MKQKILTKRNENGQGLVEYSLIGALVAVILIGVLIAIGPAIKTAMVSLITQTSGGVTVQNGELILPGLSITQTPINSSTQFPTSTTVATLTTVPTFTAVPTFTPIPTSTTIPTSTPTILACTAGSAFASNQSACASLSASNGCSSYTYKRWSRLCTWK
ncbi:MAG: Flp family type IVb pilin [Anaerolineales bacterium]|uniref:Flp family type IVb pilin n=1 Tax=Candidatus Villigracilis affinis TaxID=3140682 RepID=UPI002A1D3D4B|nr:Flp family type IVb pilin [Anaerolineales bacterium]MBL0343959.1 Flp family type IVb pilin [Anaerolineales bacterium]